jgi:adenylate kinase family enzyme
VSIYSQRIKGVKSHDGPDEAAMVSLPRRIAVVGRAGAGKTTIALRLHEALGLPVVHLDALYWTPDWKEVGEDEFDLRQRMAVERPEWIIDGGYLSSAGAQARLDRSDLVIVAEAPLVVCLWRVLARAMMRGRARPDRAAGGGEQLSLYFLWWIVTWTRRHPQLASTIRDSGKRVLVVRRLTDLEPLLRGEEAV